VSQVGPGGLGSLLDVLQERLLEAREHAEALDKNWSTLHEASMSAIRDALGMPDATVPEMVQAIQRMRARLQS